jgi:hypothetical protein
MTPEQQFKAFLDSLCGSKPRRMPEPHLDANNPRKYKPRTGKRGKPKSEKTLRIIEMWKAGKKPREISAIVGLPAKIISNRLGIMKYRGTL